MREERTFRHPCVLAGVVVLMASAALAQNDISQSRRNAVVQAIERAAPAVVSVNVIEVQAERVMDPFSRDFWDLFMNPGGQYRIRQRQINSVASGFFFDDQGHILTNYHVVAGGDSVASVTLPDGRELEVELVGYDDRSDVAVLRAKGEQLPYIPLGDSSSLLLGEWVIAIGNPFGTLMADPQPSVSVGVVSANHRRVSRNAGEGERFYQDMIQTDAAINPGNSGGPLVNAEGSVVGINTMIFSPSGGSVGIGFAIPINRAKRVAQEIIQYGRRRDPWAGFKVQDIQSLRPDLLQQVGTQSESGCLVVNILSNCPAYQAGLRPGDAITSINGQRVQTSSDIEFVILNLFVGDNVTLDIERQGTRNTISFPVQELAK